MVLSDNDDFLAHHTDYDDQLQNLLDNVTTDQSLIDTTAPITLRQQVLMQDFVIDGSNGSTFASATQFLVNVEDDDSLTVQAVGQLTAAALVPDAGLPGFSPEEQELVAARRQELEELRVRDNAAYEQQIALSKQLLTQAGYVDPTYFANQARNQVAILGARQRKELEDERAFNPTLGDFTTADINRMNIDQARRQASAFDTGFLKGIDLQGQLLTDAGKTIPSSPTAYSVGLDRLQDDVAGARTIADTQRKNIAGLTSALNTTSGRDEEDEENLKRITQNTIAGLNTDNQNYLDNRFDMSLDDEALKNQLTGRT